LFYVSETKQLRGGGFGGLLHRNNLAPTSVSCLRAIIPAISIGLLAIAIPTVSIMAYWPHQSAWTWLICFDCVFNLHSQCSVAETKGERHKRIKWNKPEYNQIKGNKIQIKQSSPCSDVNLPLISIQRHFCTN